MIWMRRGFIASGISRSQVDDEQAVLEAGALDLDVVGERELALEIAGRDAAMQEALLFLLALAAFEGQHVLLDRQRDFLRREARERDRNLETVLVRRSML